MGGLTPAGFLLRLVFAFGLVAATYNPTPYSYYAWVSGLGWEWTAPVVFVGIVLLIGWVIFLRASLRSLGAIGLLLACAFFAALFWLLADWGWVPLDSMTAITWIALVVLAAILAVGMSWSHLRRRWSGQSDVTELHEN
jgi:Family of unknown function (DUF6524)